MNKKNKRIVIIGDSLAMPRPEEGVYYEDTYAYLLNIEFEVINRSRRGNNTKIQTLKQNILDDIEYLTPDIVIVHLGIVDCAPRLFTKNEYKLLGRLPYFIRKRIISFFSKYRFFFTKIRQITYIDKKNFKINIENIMEVLYSLNIQPIIINIANTNSRNIKRSYGIQENINQYNLILKEISTKFNTYIVDINKSTNLLLEDGIHINKNAHKIIFDELLERIKNDKKNI